MSDVTKGDTGRAAPRPGGLSSDTKAVLAFEAARKSTGLAYVLWFFFGTLGGHRFYLGRTGSGIAMLVIFLISLILTVVYIGFLGLAVLAIWAIVDAFLIPGMARRYNEALVRRIESGLGG